MQLGGCESDRICSLLPNPLEYWLRFRAVAWNHYPGSLLPCEGSWTRSGEPVCDDQRWETWNSHFESGSEPTGLVSNLHVGRPAVSSRSRVASSTPCRLPQAVVGSL